MATLNAMRREMQVPLPLASSSSNHGQLDKGPPNESIHAGRLGRLDLESSR